MSSPPLPAVTNSFASLVFFYDPVLKQVQFSNIAPKLFFGSPVNMENEFPFSLIADKTDVLDIDRDWQTCLQLKEDETHDFWFQKKLTGQTGIIFHFHASGVKMEKDEGSSLSILFTAEKTVAGKDAAWMRELDRLRTSLDRYKEEYAEFIDIAAHNLDAPLRKLNVLIDRVTAKYSKDEEAKNYVQRITACLSDMRSLIDSLAILSRITAGAIQSNSCRIDQVIEGEWQELRLPVQESNASIQTGSLPQLEGDLSQYKELFKQLLSNSIRFSKKEEAPEISVTATNVTEKERSIHGLLPGKEYVKIEISDNGIGFRQEYAEKIFRPFLRLHGKSEYPGNGIGLALCKRIVENHRGIIYAESAENEGARFVLLLPQTLN